MIKLFNRAEIGKKGEKIAARYLRRHGYKIIEKNSRASHKEIDIIAENKDYILFVEVKTRSVGEDLYSSYGAPASAVGKKKRENLLYASRLYLASNNTRKQPRMDVIEVYLNKDTAKVIKINHIENAYYAK